MSSIGKAIGKVSGQGLANSGLIKPGAAANPALDQTKSGPTLSDKIRFGRPGQNFSSSSKDPGKDEEVTRETEEGQELKEKNKEEKKEEQTADAKEAVKKFNKSIKQSDVEKSKKQKEDSKKAKQAQEGESGDKLDGSRGDPREGKQTGRDGKFVSDNAIESAKNNDRLVNDLKNPNANRSDTDALIDKANKNGANLKDPSDFKGQGSQAKAPNAGSAPQGAAGAGSGGGAAGGQAGFGRAGGGAPSRSNVSGGGSASKIAGSSSRDPSGSSRSAGSGVGSSIKNSGAGVGPKSGSSFVSNPGKGSTPGGDFKPASAGGTTMPKFSDQPTAQQPKPEISEGPGGGFAGEEVASAEKSQETQSIPSDDFMNASEDEILDIA